jgi:hypothetical protein
MKRLMVVIATLFIVPFVTAQRLSLDVMPGFINYAGDLQPRSFTLNQAKPAVQLGLSYKLTDNIYLRANYLGGSVGAEDKKSGKSKLYPRNLDFTTIILEGSLNLEYDFFKLGQTKNWTPYIFAGGGYFFFNPYTHDTLGNKVYLQPLSTEGEGLPEYPKRKQYSLYQFNVLGGIGVKYALSERFTIGFEICERLLFTDYLDDVSTTYVDPTILQYERGPEAVELAWRGNELNPPLKYPKVGSPRGNPGSKDAYYTGMFRFTYNFLGNTSFSNKRSMNCPRRVL